MTNVGSNLSFKQDKHCPFCKIVRKEAFAKILYNDSDILAFEDINPQAPYHILVIPKKHIASFLEISSQDTELVGKIHQVIKKIAKEKNFKRGFRVVVNCGPDAGQSIDHLHFHLLAGREFDWPPG